MDLWVVAAAAGAGYLAKYWQKVLRDKEGSSGFPSGTSFHDDPESPSLIRRIREKTCPILKLSTRGTAAQNFNEGGNRLRSDGILAETSKGDGSTPNDGENGNSEYNGEYDSGVTDVPDIDYHTWQKGASHGSRNNSGSRSKRIHLQFIKPRNSLDSCLMAQMHREHAEIEEYLLSPLASPCTPTLRPFFVTDGKRVISRTSGDFRDGMRKVFHPKANDEVVGVPPLPQIRPAEYAKEKLNKGKIRMGNSSSTSKQMQFDSQGSSSGQVLFCLGISIGIMSTIIANKLELEKLKENLKQSENLVQDLQEELEMKDSLTVKELVYDDDSQDTHENLCGYKKLNVFSNQVDTNVSTNCPDEESVTLKEVESMSKIEAELEAELERLELSMNGSSLRRTLSDAIEFDQEFDDENVAELVHGELNAGNIRRKSSSDPTPDGRSSGTPTPSSAKFCVSPRELSLRLHEVIQARLQMRITELEAELTRSQRRVNQLESERININSWREVSNSESSSTMGSPIGLEAHSPKAQGFVMNLSGDALDAYNEAYEALSNLRGSHVDSQEDSREMHRKNDDGEKLLANGRTKIASSRGSPNGYEDEDDDLLLIKQIVEKARQGSPALLRAQKAMVYLDKD